MKIFLIILFILNILSDIDNIGEPREPRTRKGVIITTIINLVLIWGICLCF